MGEPAQLLRRSTPAAALLAAVTAVALTACTPTGDGAGVGGVGGCDPAGFGPLSGCDHHSTPGPQDPPPADEPDPDPARVCPPEWGASFGEDGEIDFTDPGTFHVTPGSACEAEIERDSRKFNAGFLNTLDRELHHPTPRDWTVHDTHPLPDGGCLVGLDEVGAEHFSRRPMPGDCSRYPLGSHQHTGGGTP